MRVGRGFSLLEGIMGIAVLLIGVSLVLPMFDVALRYTTRVEQETVATTLARSRLAELRAWAADPAHYANIVSFPGVSAPDPNYPDYAILVTFANVTLPTGCSKFEDNYVLDPRILSSSCRHVQIRVSWTVGGLPSQITLVSLVGAPALALDPTPPSLVAGPVQIAVTSGSLTNMPHDALANLTASVKDSGGNPIPDVMVKWSIVPQTGRGTVTQNRSGSLATFQNKAFLWTGMPTYTKGSCRVRASVRYHGIETWGYSPDITLQ